MEKTLIQKVWTIAPNEKTALNIARDKSGMVYRQEKKARDDLAKVRERSNTLWHLYELIFSVTICQADDKPEKMKTDRVCPSCDLGAHERCTGLDCDCGCR